MRHYFIIFYLAIQFLATGQNTVDGFSFEKERLILGLKSLDKSNDELTLRIWVDPKLTNGLELFNIVFTRTDSTYISYFTADQNSKFKLEKIVGYKVLEGLRVFLIKNNYSTLPNYEDIFPKLEKRMPDGTVIDPLIVGDGVNYIFQFKNNHSKREYTFHCPFEYQKEYPKIEEFNNVTNIIDYLQSLLKVQFRTKC